MYCLVYVVQGEELRASGMLHARQPEHIPLSHPGWSLNNLLWLWSYLESLNTGLPCCGPQFPFCIIKRLEEASLRTS